MLGFDTNHYLKSKTDILVGPFKYKHHPNVLLLGRGIHGAAKLLFSVITLGVGLFIPFFDDTGHFCPQCGRQVAVAKIM